MAHFSTETWTLLALIAGAGVLAFLHALGAAARNEVYIHDLQVRVARLRVEYFKRIRENGADQLGPGIIEVSPVDDEEHHAPARKAA